MSNGGSGRLKAIPVFLYCARGSHWRRKQEDLFGAKLLKIHHFNNLSNIKKRHGITNVRKNKNKEISCILLRLENFGFTGKASA